MIRIRSDVIAYNSLVLLILGTYFMDTTVKRSPENEGSRLFCLQIL